MTESAAETEFSRPVRVEQIPVNGMDMDLTARPAEREALAKRFDVRAVETLTATVRLQSLARGTLVRVSGQLSARVIQTCVISLEPVVENVSESFSMSFCDTVPETHGDMELELSYDEEDPPDPIVGGSIDVGEVVAEQLALALNPFPRKEGVEFERKAEGEDEGEGEKRPNPFAALAELRKNKG